MKLIYTFDRVGDRKAWQINAFDEEGIFYGKGQMHDNPSGYIFQMEYNQDGVIFRKRISGHRLCMPAAVDVCIRAWEKLL